MTADNFTSLPCGDLAAAIYAIIEDQVEKVLGATALPLSTSRLVVLS
ncbi:hypothetical protein [Mycobacterium lepromatosis]